MISRLHRRRVVLALGACAFAVPLISFAQQPAPGVHRIVFLGQRSRSIASVPDAYYEAFVQGMRELGYVEGKNLLIEWRVADGKPEGFAAELVSLKVDVVVTDSTPAAQIARAATRIFPSSPQPWLILSAAALRRAWPDPPAISPVCLSCASM